MEFFIDLVCSYTRNFIGQFPYKYFLAAWSWPPIREWQYSGGRGSCLFTFSGLLVVMGRVSTEEASCHYPANNTRLEADPVPLGLAKWWLEVGCWLPKPVKQNISRHRGGHADKRVGSVAAFCQWSTGSTPCNPPLSHPVGEGGLAIQGHCPWRPTGGPLVLCL